MRGTTRAGPGTAGQASANPRNGCGRPKYRMSSRRAKARTSRSVSGSKPRKRARRRLRTVREPSPASCLQDMVLTRRKKSHTAGSARDGDPAAPRQRALPNPCGPEAGSKLLGLSRRRRPVRAFPAGQRVQVGSAKLDSTGCPNTTYVPEKEHWPMTPRIRQAVEHARAPLRRGPDLASMTACGPRR